VTKIKTLLLALLFGVSACDEKSTTTTVAPTPTPLTSVNRIGTSFSCAINVWGAYNVDDASRLGQLLPQGDKQAILIMVQRGKLVLVRKGTLVTLEGIKAFGSVEMFTARGNPDILYVPIGLME
jgi:hypothetical protein